MSITFNAAAIADVETLLTLMREYYAYDQHAFVEAKARRALNEFLADTYYGLAWLIQEGEALIGYAVLTFGYSLEFGGRDAFVDELYLREAYRGRGIGKQTIAHLLNVCREQGIKALHLEVVAHNTKARAFYEQIGFEDRGGTLMSHPTAD
jgi:GNAT superfamily N-acetyltransferase